MFNPFCGGWLCQQLPNALRRKVMEETLLVQRAYTAVLEHFMKTGRAPHYTELAATLGLKPEEARLAQRKAADFSYRLLVCKRNGLRRILGAFFQCPNPSFSDNRRGPEMVRSVRTGSAGRALALPENGGPYRHAVPGLRRPHPNPHARRRYCGNQSLDGRGACECPFRQDPEGRSNLGPRLKPHEPLPVGSSRQKLASL